jgi:hypothetical protein
VRRKRVGEIMPPLSRQQQTAQTGTDSPEFLLPCWLEPGDNPRRKLQIIVAHSTAQQTIPATVAVVGSEQSNTVNGRAGAAFRRSAFYPTKCRRLPRNTVEAVNPVT